MAKPETINITDLAKLTKLDRATISKRLEAAGLEHSQGRKMHEKVFDKAEALAALEVSAESRDDFKKEQARKMRLDADKREMELAEMRGELLPVYEVREQMQKVIQRLYQKLCIQQPKEIAAAVAKMKSPAEIEKHLREINSKTFADLRRDHSKMLGN